jgi:uncharacterized membrane protein
MTRRGYIDWLRGISVLIMIEAHTLDAWTRLADRHNAIYAWAMIVAGFAAPSFLFLAGVSLALASGARIRRGRTDAEAAALARRRALQIFGLAFLFRLQSIVISSGSLSQLLKVDILNIMGLSMLAAAWLWGFGRSRLERVSWMIAATILVAMVTPLVRSTPLLSPLPDPIEWYLRPALGRGTFTLFPWSAFLLAGAAVGLWLDASRASVEERRTNIALGAIGVALAVGGYATSFLPPIYPDTSFWTTSPTFFFLRLGILLLALPLAYAWNAAWEGRSVLQEFGRASLFVYWIHVELAYGVLSGPIHKQLTLEEAFIAYALFSVALFGAAKLKDRFVDWWKQPRGPAYAGAAS